MYFYLITSTKRYLKWSFELASHMHLILLVPAEGFRRTLNFGRSLSHDRFVPGFFYALQGW